MTDAPRYASPPVPSGLRRWIDRIWVVEAENGLRHVAMPDARIDLVLVKGAGFDGLFVSGPVRRAFEGDLRGRVKLSGVSLRPGLGAIFGPEAEALPASWTPVADLASPSRVRRADRLEGLVNLVAERAEALAFDRSFLAVHSALADWRPGLSAETLALRLGCSPRTVNRWFLRHVGMSPKAYDRLRRFRTAAEAISGGKTPLAEIALDHGFADQSHMARDIRALGGATSRTIARRVAADFP